MLTVKMSHIWGWICKFGQQDSGVERASLRKKGEISRNISRVDPGWPSGAYHQITRHKVS